MSIGIITVIFARWGEGVENKNHEQTYILYKTWVLRWVQVYSETHERLAEVGRFLKCGGSLKSRDNV